MLGTATSTAIGVAQVVVGFVNVLIVIVVVVSEVARAVRGRCRQNELRDSKPRKIQAMRMGWYRDPPPTRILTLPTPFLSLSTGFLGVLPSFCECYRR